MVNWLGILTNTLWLNILRKLTSKLSLNFQYTRSSFFCCCQLYWLLWKLNISTRAIPNNFEFIYDFYTWRITIYVLSYHMQSVKKYRCAYFMYVTWYYRELAYYFFLSWIGTRKNETTENNQICWQLTFDCWLELSIYILKLKLKLVGTGECGPKSIFKKNNKHFM